MEKVNIQLIRNATVKLNYAGKTILVDPMLSNKQSFMSFVEPDKNHNPTIDLPLSAEKVVKNIDAVLLTHAHPDHLDPKAIEVLPEDITLIGQIADKEALEQTPFSNITLVEEKEVYGDISIHRTSGKHGPDALLDVLGTVSGFVLQAENYPTLYVVGDCLLDETIKANIKQFNPDIIITNSGGAIFMGEHQILMNANDTVEVAKLAPSAKVVAVHMEALDHCTVTRDEMNKKTREAGVKVYVPEDGETVVL